jgi:hypothetical protein
MILGAVVVAVSLAAPGADATPSRAEPVANLKAVEADATPRQPVRSIGIDAIGLYSALSVGDVVLPLEIEAPMLYRMRFFGRAHAGISTGAGAGLFGFGGQVGFRLYPFSPDPLKGFNIQLAGGVTIPGSVSPAPFAWPRPYASLGLGYAVRIGDYIQLSPGIELTPFTGFPLGPPLALRCGVAWTY